MLNIPTSKQRLVLAPKYQITVCYKIMLGIICVCLMFGYCISSGDLGVHFTPLMTFRLYSVHWSLIAAQHCP